MFEKSGAGARAGVTDAAAALDSGSAASALRQTPSPSLSRRRRQNRSHDWQSDGGCDAERPQNFAALNAGQRSRSLRHVSEKLMLAQLVERQPNYFFIDRLIKTTRESTRDLFRGLAAVAALPDE